MWSCKQWRSFWRPTEYCDLPASHERAPPICIQSQEMVMLVAHISWTAFELKWCKLFSRSTNIRNIKDKYIFRRTSYILKWLECLFLFSTSLPSCIRTFYSVYCSQVNGFCTESECFARYNRLHTISVSFSPTNC